MHRCEAAHMTNSAKKSCAASVAFALLATACGGSGGGTPPGHGGAGPHQPDSRYAALKAQADDAKKLTGPEALAAYPTAFGELKYDPMSAEYLDRIQASTLALNAGETAAFARNGFVISNRHAFPTFVKGYAEIYAQHLPVFISADALLEAVHSAYDSLLASVEATTLVGKLTALLTSMREQLARSDADPATRADVDVYLAVTLSLLQNSASPPVAGGDATLIASLVNNARAAQGPATVELFGVQRDEDFSQFEPRGHYVADPNLTQYFKAMMWLGRVDLRLVETKSDGSRVFNRRQYEAMLLMRDTLKLADWQQIDDMLKLFVGPSDNIVPAQIDQLVADLGGARAARAASDAAVEQALLHGGYGQQQIASYLMVNDGSVATLPLNRSFLLLGQRYIVDSNVLSAVVYDRVADRLMPNPLDVAFGALANNQALALEPDLAKYQQLPGALARVRVLIDSNDAPVWEQSFYNSWLSALRTLSPAPDASASPAGAPSVMTTEAWGRRVLNTQLASWAELRHDTLLYAKQSYSGIPSCGFPDAYVDPYPEAFAALGKYASLGMRLTDLLPATLPQLTSSPRDYFMTLGRAATILEGIANAELSGAALTSGQLAFINDAVRIEKQSAVCTTIDVPDGWLAKLYLDRQKSIEFSPTIADVHTQPADEAGNSVGYVLHVGTAAPRLMVVTFDSCGGGPRAYAGVVFSYHEKTTNDFVRLTDSQWSSSLNLTTPPDAAWLGPALAQ
jgi:hypothetical protein